MREIADGIHHWTATHPNIGVEVSSYFLERAGTLVDPMASDEAVAWFRDSGPTPDRIVLTNRHHLRGSERFRDEFGCSILCHRSGLHEFRDGPEVEGFAFGDDLAPKLKALEVGVLCEEETALHFDHGSGALAFADGVVHYGEDLAFVPDHLLGDNPDFVKEGLRRAYARLLDRHFDVLLFAHGDPIVEDGKERLAEFVDS